MASINREQLPPTGRSGGSVATSGPTRLDGDGRISRMRPTNWLSCWRGDGVRDHRAGLPPGGRRGATDPRWCRPFGPKHWDDHRPLALRLQAVKLSPVARKRSRTSRSGTGRASLSLVSLALDVSRMKHRAGGSLNSFAGAELHLDVERQPHVLLRVGIHVVHDRLRVGDFGRRGGRRRRAHAAAGCGESGNRR